MNGKTKQWTRTESPEIDLSSYGNVACDKSDISKLWDKKQTFKYMVPGQLNNYCEKKKKSSAYHNKTNAKLIRDLKLNHANTRGKGR